MAQAACYLLPDTRRAEETIVNRKLCGTHDVLTERRRRHAGFQVTCFAIQLDPILLGMNPGRMQGEFDIGRGTAARDRCDNQQHAGVAVRVVGAEAWA